MYVDDHLSSLLRSTYTSRLSLGNPNLYIIILYLKQVFTAKFTLAIRNHKTLRF
jgi:hypothetical protein